MIGLRCYDSDGDITLDITDSLTRLVGSRVADETSGSFTVECDENDRVFAYCIPNRAEPVKIIISGHSVSWAYRNWKIDAKIHDAVIYYGTY